MGCSISEPHFDIDLLHIDNPYVQPDIGDSSQFLRVFHALGWRLGASVRYGCFDRFPNRSTDFADSRGALPHVPNPITNPTGHQRFPRRCPQECLGQEKNESPRPIRLLPNKQNPVHLLSASRSKKTKSPDAANQRLKAIPNQIVATCITHNTAPCTRNTRTRPKSSIRSKTGQHYRQRSRSAAFKTGRRRSIKRVGCASIWRQFESRRRDEKSIKSGFSSKARV